MSRLNELLHQAGGIGGNGDGSVTRVGFSREYFQALELLKEKEASLTAIRERRRKFLRSVLRSNPTASSRRYKDEFQDMIHYLEDSGKGQSPF